MSIEIPLTVVAHDEERAIGACLESLLGAMAHTRDALGLELRPLVVLDRCTDGTQTASEALGVPTVSIRGNKVLAMQRGSRPGPFQVFSDADILVDTDTLTGICEVMLQRPEVQVAFPDKQPLPRRRRAPMAWALHRYNARRGWSSQRTWFSGKLFATRHLEFPDPAEVSARAQALPDSPFYDYRAGMRVDDVWLSRKVLLEHGLAGLAEVPEVALHFRAPESLSDMHRMYRRMRMELERLDRLYPETAQVHRRHGSRGPDLLASAGLSDQLAWRMFHVALAGCKIAYRAERAWVERTRRAPVDPWPTTSTTKDLRP